MPSERLKCFKSQQQPGLRTRALCVPTLDGLCSLFPDVPSAPYASVSLAAQICPALPCVKALFAACAAPLSWNTLPRMCAFSCQLDSVWMPLEKWPWVTSALAVMSPLLVWHWLICGVLHLCLSLPCLVYFYPIPLETELHAYLFICRALGTYNSDRQVQAFNLLYTGLWMNE